MTPRKDGQLFLYLNLPVIGIWGLEPIAANWLGNKGVYVRVWQIVANPQNAVRPISRK
jgi:hypothetical protein